MVETAVIETPNKYSSPEDFVTYIRPYLGEVKTIYEFGALDGRDGRILQEHFPEAHLYLFEGLKGNYDGYLTNIDKSRATAFNVVLWNEDKPVVFWQNEENGIHSIRPHINGKVTPTYPDGRRFDSFAKLNNLPQPDIVKLDVEGCAFEVLEGMGEYLKNVQALHVETETFPYFVGQTLEDNAWKLLEKTHRLIQFNRNTVDERGTQCDSIWVKK